MRQSLQLHPDSHCLAAARIEAVAERPSPGALALRYVVTGALEKLRLPPSVAAERVDGLWRHSCFEAFIRAPSGEAYYEFNFAPSTQWAAYRFDGYRTGMGVAEPVDTPRIERRAEGDRFELTVLLMLGELADLAVDAPWRVGLSAVIEETGGPLCYWALAHPPGKADFHHSDCFAMELPAAWPT